MYCSFFGLQSQQDRKEKKEMESDFSFDPTFDNRLETSSQESTLRRCKFALEPDDSQSEGAVGLAASPVTTRGIEEENKIETASGNGEKVVAVPVDSEEQVGEKARVLEKGKAVMGVDLADVGGDAKTSPDAGKSDDGALNVKPLSWVAEPVEKAAEEKKAGERKRLKIPIREVVRAIVRNSGKKAEYEKIEKLSFLEIAKMKGVKFPDRKV